MNNNFHKLEKDVCSILKSMMDKDNNFVRPLSDFWKNMKKDICPIVDCYGLWISGDGTSCINHKSIVDYYDTNLYHGCKQLQEFMNKHNMYLSWYDPSTALIFFK